MKKTAKKKTIILILTILIAISLGVLGTLIFKNKDSNKVVDNENEEVIKIIDPYEEEKTKYAENKAINSDYVGDIYFTSGLINQSFVQATSVYKDNGELYTFYNKNGTLVSDPTGYTGNDVYIWTYWKTGEYDYNDNGGSVFMDYRNHLTDQNLIIYGHHFSEWNDETRSKSFTPLEQLLEEENYKDNKEVNLLLEDEIRTYELWAVYKHDFTDGEYIMKAQYWRCNYNYDDYTDTTDENFYQNYIDFINEHKLYDTDVELTTNDKTLTLQTCITGRAGDLYEICVFKQTGVTKFNE